MLFINANCCSSTPEITVDIKIKGISIKEGSMEGGTRLVIGGNGFGTNKTLVSSKLSLLVPCKLK